MNDFLKKVEPFLHTEDPIVFQEVVRALDQYANIPEEWSILLLKRSQESTEFRNIVLTNMRNIKFGEAAGEELLVCIEKEKSIERWRYIHPLLRLKIDALHTLFPYVKGLLKREEQKFLEELFCVDTKNEADNLLQTLIKKLEEEWIVQQDIYRRAKWAMDWMLKQNWLTGDDLYQMVENGRGARGFEISALLGVYGMGEWKEKRFVPLLGDLYRFDEDLLQEEITHALQYYQSDDVVDAVYPYCQGQDFYFPIDILSSVKSPYAVEALKRLYHEDHSNVARLDFISEGLCHQFSEEGVPEVDDFMKTYQSTGTFNKEESAYAFFKVIGQEHPRLPEWAAMIKEESKHHSNKEPVIPPQKKVGRNEPCPCGVGKNIKSSGK